MRTRKITLGYLSLGDREKEYVLKVLESNRLSYGPFIKNFEEKFAERHQSAYAIFCNSGTSALQIALHALKEKYKWNDGDEVLVPAITFVATANIVILNNMKPVFVDVHSQTWNIDPEMIESRITERTVAILPVHLFGLPCDMDPIMDIAMCHDLQIIEDSCETMFATYKGKSVGSFGEYGCFSTYVAHLLVTGVGGIITTQSEESMILARSILQHGRDSIYLSIDDDDSSESKDHLRNMIQGRFSFPRIGYSYRATELEGAIGLAQLESVDMMLQKRRSNAKYLTEALGKWENHFKLPIIPEGYEHSFMMYPIVIQSKINRERLLEYLESHGIETRYMFPLITQPFYKRLYGDIESEYPIARHINSNGFYIGCHQGLDQEDLSYIVKTFDAFIKKV